MKHAKKLTALFIVLTLLLSLSATAFAAGPYTITIEKGADGETYNAYKIFDVTITEDGEGFAYSISSASEWWSVVTGNTAADAASSFTKNGLTFTKSTTDKVWIVEKTDTFNAETFATLLADNVTGKIVAATIDNYSSATNTMTVSALGYYFVDTSLGSLCSLDTTTTSGVSIYEKNVVPTIDKTVKEPSDAGYGKTADANVGDTLNYKLTVNTGTKLVTDTEVNELPDGTGIDENYVIVDQLPNGITYTENTIAVNVGNEAWVKDTDYTVTYSDNKLTVTLLSTGKLKGLETNTEITITYNAVLGTDFTTTSLNAANQNTVTLTYHNQTDVSDAKVYTWSYDIIKYFDTNGNDKYDATDDKLKDATFQISSEENGKAIDLVQVSDNVYRPAVADDTNKVTEITTDDTGKLTLQGFDSGTYYLKETKAPDGYNKLDEVIKIEISTTETSETDSQYSKENNPAKKLTKTFAVGGETVTDATVYVENQTGAELPSTGGIGTTIFYVLGGLLAAGALVLLITNKRMKPEN